MSEFESVLDGLGSFGPYQRRLFILVSLFETPTSWAMLLPVFTGASPGFRCSGAPANSTVLQPSTGYVVANDTAYRNATLDGHSMTNSSQHCLADGSPCPGLAFNEYEFTSIVTEWNLVCGNSYVSDLVTTLQMVGLLLGATATGQLADLYGRRRLLFITYALMLVATFGSGWANSWQLYAALRTVVGAAIGGHMVVNFVLPMEWVGRKWRTFCGCIGFWAIGLMILPLWAYFIRSWRYLTMATSVCGLPLLLTYWWTPESARWLVQRGRFDEAEAILTSAAQFNKLPVPDFSLLRAFAKADKEMKEQAKKYSYCHLFIDARSATITLVCLLGWFVSSSVYYGFSFNLKNIAGDRYLNFFISGLVELPALAFVLVVNNRLGRRWTIFGLFLVAGLSLASIAIIDNVGGAAWLASSTWALIAPAMVGKSALSGGWAAVQIFSAEQFPTLVRNLGIAACSMAARVGGIVAPQIGSLGVQWKPVPFAVFGSLATVCAVSFLFLKETTNKPLPDRLRGPQMRAQLDDATAAVTPGTVDLQMECLHQGDGPDAQDADVTVLVASQQQSNGPA